MFLRSQTKLSSAILVNGNSILYPQKREKSEIPEKLVVKKKKHAKVNLVIQRRYCKH